MTTTKKTPDDQPFEFSLDAFDAEEELRPFRFMHGGRRWEFQHLQMLDVWELAKEAEGGDAGEVIQMFTVALGDKDKVDEFRKIPLPGKKMNALYEAWLEHCGVEPGESDGSTDS